VAPETHLLLSWIIAAKTTDNPRDCRLVTLAGILPDVDGLGLIVDFATEGLGLKQTHLYGEYHHYLLHGALGGILIAALATSFARHRWRVALLALLVFHLHLFCDFVGSRGPSPKTRCGSGTASCGWTAGSTATSPRRYSCGPCGWR